MRDSLSDVWAIILNSHMAVEILLGDSTEASANAKMRHDINYHGVQVKSSSERGGDECQIIAIVAQCNQAKQPSWIKDPNQASISSHAL